MLDGYVLNSILYKETSLIIKIFTKEHGINSLVVKGARRRNSKFFGILQPFIPLSIYCKHWNQELALLHHAEVRKGGYRLAGLYLLGALYINELLLRLLTSQDLGNELFPAYEVFLHNLSKCSKLQLTETASNQLLLEQHLRVLEKQILKAIGYELELIVESRDKSPVIPEKQYYFDMEHGLQKYDPIHSTSHAPPGLIQGSSLLALYADQLNDPVVMKQAKNFMRQVLANFLGEQPLRSRKFFVKYNAVAQAI